MSVVGTYSFRKFILFICMTVSSDGCAIAFPFSPNQVFYSHWRLAFQRLHGIDEVDVLVI